MIWRPAKAAKLVRQKSAGKTDIETPAADRVQHADLTGELERMVKDRQYGTRHQARAPRALRGGGEEQHRVGAVPAVVMKIMLDDADVRKHELLCLLHKGESIAKILGTGFLIGPDIGKKLHAKLHW